MVESVVDILPTDVPGTWLSAVRGAELVGNRWATPHCNVRAAAAVARHALMRESTKQNIVTESHYHQIYGARRCRGVQTQTHQ